MENKFEKFLRLLEKALLTDPWVDEFHLTAGKLEAYQTLFYYITHDERFEAQGYSFKKGIYLHGPVGRGKTAALVALQRIITGEVKLDDAELVVRDVDGVVFKPRFNIEPTNQMNFHFAESGNRVLQQYAYLINLCIDDMGNEPAVSNFGNKLNVVGEVLTLRYDYKAITHATSNLAPNQMVELYGERVADRMNQMFNLIPFDPEGESLRT